MNRSTIAGRAHLLLTAGLLLLALTWGAAAPLVHADEQYVFTIGIVERLSGDTLTLSFEDGSTETYTLNGATTIQTQNGDALSPADISAGDMVIVLTVEHSSVAVTIVNGGENGFHEAGPGDIRGHDQRECAACDAHTP